MAYYDALIAKWPGLTGASASSDTVAAARTAYAVAQPQPSPAPENGWAGTDDANASRAAYVAALQAWHQSWASLFLDPAVTAKLAQINALSDGTTPWWQSAGYTSPIGTGDLEAVFAESNGAEALV